MKRTIIMLIVTLVLVSGAVTAYAVSAEGNGKEPTVASQGNQVLLQQDCLAEDMAIEAYVQNTDTSFPENAEQAVG